MKKQSNIGWLSLALLISMGLASAGGALEDQPLPALGQGVAGPRSAFLGLPLPVPRLPCRPRTLRLPVSCSLFPQPGVTCPEISN